MRRAIALDEPVLVVVDAAKIATLRATFPGTGDLVEFADMASVGTNPARIIPAWQAFVDRHAGAGRPIHGIGEPIWAGRSPGELVECRHHEALLNVAFADVPAFTLMCPYDTSSLDPAVVAGAHGTHPRVRDPASDLASAGYHGVDAAALLGEPLPAPPDDVRTWSFSADLAAARRFAVQAAAILGFGELTDDIALVVAELTTNSIRHGGGHGALSLWADGDTLVCEVRDAGSITDPLVGRRRPRRGQIGGRGLWVVNQLSDLVQVRSVGLGSTVRVHLSPRSGGMTLSM